MSGLAKNLNLGLAFLLELVVYVSVGGWGFTARPRLSARLLLGLGGPLLLIVLWALFGAPTATYMLSDWPRIGFEVLWYGAGAVALAAWWRKAPAAVFATLVVLSGVLARVWGQQE
ncbi:YrdB family protein [Kitasatospora sp. NPDC057015]|uniref:YrdB family protein n=1 Tax=Kitasatospora sp. NPDC057015 TaxID=3346001 RepID=UPI00363040DC